MQLSKPERLAKVRARRRRVKYQHVREIRAAVFERDQHTCRVCGHRAESMHELRFRSLGGDTSLTNSIAVCGSGTTGCHGLLQRHLLRPQTMDANHLIEFSVDPLSKHPDILAMRHRMDARGGC